MRLGNNLVVGLSAIAGWHGYLWLRLVRGTTRSRALRIGGAVVLAGCGALIPALLLQPKWISVAGQRALQAVTFAWMGVAILTATALSLLELVRLGLFVARKARGKDPPSPERRFAIGRALGGAGAFLGLGAVAVGTAEALDLVIQRARVPLRKLPASLDGLRIVQISDLHFGARIGPDYLREVVARVNALNPDLVAITGDLVDGSVRDQGERIRPLSELRAKYGVFFVTGNHEYYVDPLGWMAYLPELGIRVLRNERVSIGTGADSFDLAGVDDLSAAHYEIGHGHDLATALEGRDPHRELVLLAHQPRSAYEASTLGVGLQLSGHTHGGQLWPVRFILYFEQPFVDGLHKLRDTWVYVSRGTGYWGPAMRVGAPPEISEITLVRA